uniref:Uncharacterized protein n=1 Tax=Alexandrium catenella TaxID=2925 RepID=A0A7S1WSI0_ALECA|mmetsp:Transcript_85408/g.226778  ORF Transcript_85408/g.226778 Transcript_85408/m.226778 type:complete len:277 (+) Transcript_85408:2-832(+)
MAGRLLLAVLSAAIALASDSPARRLKGMAHCHVDILINNLNYGKMSDVEEQVLSRKLAGVIAGKIGARPEDIMTFEKVHGHVMLKRGTTVFKWLPESWPSRTNPSGETTLIACVIRFPKSTVYIAESAVNQDAFKEEIVGNIGLSLGESPAINGPLTVSADFIGPINPDESSEKSFTADPSKSDERSTARQPWSVRRFHTAGGVNWTWIVVISLIVLVAICAIVGLVQSRRSKQRHGGFLSMLGREPPRETWRDKMHDMLSVFWKKPAGGYGITGH